MNPELRRNLWIEFTANRMVIFPLVLALLYIPFAVGGHDGSGYQVFIAAHLGFSCLLGSRHAMESVVNEVRDHTWNGQRMSPLGAWSMTWGKLLGATSYAWYGALLALTIALLGFENDAPLVVQAQMVIILLSSGVFAQAVAFSVGLEQTSEPKKARGRSSLLFLFVALSVAGIFSKAATPVFRNYGLSVQWYGIGIPLTKFLVVSSLVFMTWSLLGAYRMMRTELLYRSTPVVWVSFLLFLAFYINGFIWSSDLANFDRKLPHVRVGADATFLVSALLFMAGGWALLLTERKDVVRFRRAYLRVKERRNLGELLLYVPKWLTCVVLAVPAILGYAVASLAPSAGAEITSGGFALLFSLFLLLIRDASIVMYIHASPRFRQRAQTTTAIVLMIFYVLLPWVLYAIGAGMVSKSLLPSITLSFGQLFLLLSQVALFSWLLWSRWRDMFSERRALSNVTCRS